MNKNLDYLQFYKPNSRNSGMAVSVKASDKDSGVYFSFIRQSGWNDSTKTGSFKANMDNPKAKKNIKFNATEAAGIIRAIREKGKWTSYHKFQTKGEGGAQSGVSIMFSPFEKEGVAVGFGLRITDSREKENPFSVTFTLDESELLSIYLQEYIKNTFLSSKEANKPIETEVLSEF